MKMSYGKRFNEIESVILSLIETNQFDKLTKHDIIYQKLKTLNKSIKTEITSKGFSNFDEEVNFFKNIKPSIYGWFETLNYIKKMEAKFMDLDLKMSKELIDAEYNKCRKYMIKNSYIPVLKEKGIEFDMIHFTQLSKKSYNNISVLDDEYSCLLCKKLVKFYRRKFYIIYLDSKKNTLADNKKNVQTQTINKLKWNGTSNDYVELVYGLARSGTINNAHITFTEVHRKLSMIFEFDKEIDIHSTINEVKKRKKDLTKYLDRMRDSLYDYLNE